MRTNYSVKNSITSFTNNIITFIVMFVGQTLFIKILGVEYTGLNGLFSNILTLLNLFELGFGSAITYNLYKYIKNNDKETIKSILRFYKKAYNYIAILIFLVGLLFIPFLKYIVKDVSVNININIIYILFLISTISTYLITYKRNLLFASQRNYIINIINIIYVIVLNILQILILFLTKNYYLYLIIKIICILLENIVISIKVNKDYPYILEKNINPIDKKIKQDIFNKIRALVMHKVSGAITKGTDNILISYFFGIKIVGLYTSYNYIISSINKLFSNIVSASRASVGNLLVEGNKEKNYQVFKRISFLNFWITIFTTACLFILIEPFIKIWLGSNFLLDKIVLITLMINYYQVMMRNTYIVFKDAAGIWVEDKYVPLIKSILNIVTSIILLKIFGLAGVFMGTIVSSLVQWFYSYPKFVYINLLNRSIKNYINDFITHFIILVSVLLICYFINIYSTNIFISFIICMIIPNLILYLLFRNKDEFKYYINLFKKFRKKRGTK